VQAVILAAGREADLEPLTADIPAAMVPVLDRPVMAHTVGLLRRHGVERIVAVLRRHPQAVRRHFGDELTYEIEPRPLGTAGTVLACRHHLGDEPFLVVSGQVLTDLDVAGLLEAHRAAGALVTSCLGTDGRPAGVYVLEPAVLEHVPAGRAADFEADVFPALGDRVRVLEAPGYCLVLDSVARVRQGAFDLLEGRVRLPVSGEQVAPGLTLGEGSSLDGIAMIEPPVWIGDDVQIGEHARLRGPLVVGHGATIGDGAQLRGSVILPGSTVPRESILVDGVAGLVDSSG
jgi:mannose-1-phosphate guanylyltransferase/mannose-1-phosphate guanylyltransferase/phosphomannomutase